MIRAALLLVVLALGACTHEIDESMLLYPHRGAAVDVETLAGQFPSHEVRREWITAPDGTRLQALRFERPDAVAAVLYFGGNGYTIGNFAAATAGAYRGLPVDLVLVDHRGYGGSGGRAGVEALLDDALVVHRHAAERARDRGLPLVVHGHSLGSFLAGHVAAAHRLDGLVLESSVTTIEDWGGHFQSMQPWWMRFAVRRVEPAPALRGRGNAGLMERLDEPVLFLVGDEDALTPARFTRALYAGARLPERCKRLVVVPGKGHDGATQSREFREAMGWLLSLRPPGDAAVTMQPPRRPTRERPDAAADLPAPCA